MDDSEDHSAELVRFHAEAAALRETVNAKFDAVFGVIGDIKDWLGRLTTTVEKQNEQNVQVAVLANTVAHQSAQFTASMNDFKTELHEVKGRLSKAERGLWSTNWKINAGRAVVFGGAGALATFVAHNFDFVKKLLGIH